MTGRVLPTHRGSCRPDYARSSARKPRSAEAPGQAPRKCTMSRPSGPPPLVGGNPGTGPTKMHDIQALWTAAPGRRKPRDRPRESPSFPVTPAKARHSRESGNPFQSKPPDSRFLPALARMTGNDGPKETIHPSFMRHRVSRCLDGRRNGPPDPRLPRGSGSPLPTFPPSNPRMGMPFPPGPRVEPTP